MKHFVIVAIVMLFEIHPRVLFGQSIEQQILTAQDTRNGAGLASFFANSDPAIRSRSAFAAASVQDASHAGKLIELLSDAEPDVREAAALALGQLNPTSDSTNRRSISDALLARLDVEHEEFVSVKIVEALGKTGDVASLSGLLKTLQKERPDVVRFEIALSVGRYAYRGIKNAEVTAAVVSMVENSAHPDRWKAAYALMRINDTALLEKHTPAIAAVQSKDANVNMFIASALGKVVDQSQAQSTLRQMTADLDWRVRVNAVKALGNAKPASMPDAGEIVSRLAMDSNEHVALQAMATLQSMSLGAAASTNVLSLLKGIIENPGSSKLQIKSAAVGFAKIGGIESHEFLHQQYTSGKISSSAFLESLGLIPSDAARQELFSLAGPADVHEQRIALESIISSCKMEPRSTEDIARARSILQNALESRDMAVLTVAADGLADSVYADKSSPPKLVNALNRLHSPDDVEPMVAIINALGSLKDQSSVDALVARLQDPAKTVGDAAASALEAITGTLYKDKVSGHTEALYTNHDWALLDWIRTHPEIRVQTTRGEFKIKLIPDEAPFTCITFASLIRKKFYNGLNCHRVVPNFVVQGGDPRGDGWGGPGFAIRSEFGYATYDRGFVGVASSGKDTEGCQFFVTHSKQPHLDGRYTIFGKVSVGMGVVDQLQIGDRIENISFVSNEGMPAQK